MEYSTYFIAFNENTSAESLQETCDEFNTEKTHIYSLERADCYDDIYAVITTKEGLEHLIQEHSPSLVISQAEYVATHNNPEQDFTVSMRNLLTTAFQ